MPHPCIVGAGLTSALAHCLHLLRSRGYALAHRLHLAPALAPAVALTYTLSLALNSAPMRMPSPASVPVLYPGPPPPAREAGNISDKE
ncbi:MAG TPA: hypothetical protein VEU97_09665 [Ktedonobacteraceae bacterium]|nr:hypothetical protein [Ktedonobacteraceae bacterium]